jgi:thioredoxin-related protein
VHGNHLILGYQTKLQMQTLKMSLLFCWVVVFSCAEEPAVKAGKEHWMQKEGGATTEKLKWMSLDDAAAGLEKEKRPVLIDLYTDWCSWCKVMDKKTYGNSNVSGYVQQKFYPVKFDAEGRKSITWNGKTYDFNARQKTHDFAIYLTNGQLSYPTTVFIPADGEPQAIPGFLNPGEFELLVKYFGEGKYGKVPFDEYQKSFKASW